MDLKVEGSELQKMIEGAVLTALGTQAKEALVKEVVNHLTTKPSGGGYGHRPSSPLIDALHQAARNAANKYFAQRVETDPDFCNSLELLYKDAVKRFFDTETREKTVERMADRLSAAFAEKY